MLKQISVFVENKIGRLSAIMGALNDVGIDVRSLTISDNVDFGIVRLIVNDTDKAMQALKDNNFTSNVTDVLGFTIADRVGTLYEVINVFDQNGININYSYSMMGKKLEEADIIVKTDECEKAIALLDAKGISTLSMEDII